MNDWVRSEKFNVKGKADDTLIAYQMINCIKKKQK